MSTLKKLSFSALLTKHQATLSKVRAPAGGDGQAGQSLFDFAKDLMTLLSDQQLSLEALLGQGLIPGDNFDWQKIVFTSNATPDTEDTVAHSLKRIPEGFIVINADKAAQVYRGSTSWTSSNLYLKTNVASAELTLYVF